MMMHLAVPAEFDSIIDLDEGNADEMPEQQIRQLWGESFEIIDERSLSFQFLASLKQFFQDKSLNFAPNLKTIF